MHAFSLSVRIAATAFVGATMIGCAPIRVSTYTERNVDLATFATYGWGPIGERPTGDPRLDANPFFNERIVAAVDRELAARGYERATTGRPDLTVHYHVNITDAVNVNDSDRRAGYCPGGDCRPFVYEAGTLLFDLVDTRTQQVVWRGWAEHSVDAMIDKQEIMEGTIDELVGRIFGQLARRS